MVMGFAGSVKRLLPPLTPRAWLRHDLIWDHLADVPRGSRLLEIGAGQGAMGARLARHFEYLGIERDPTSGQLARHRVESERGGAQLVVGELADLGDLEVVEILCAFEVLEHVADDLGALKEWRELLRPGGRLVLSVPTFPERFGAWDDLVGHYRRYEPDDLRAMLEAAGYVDVRLRLYGFPLGWLLEAVRNGVAQRRTARPTHRGRTAQSGRLLQPSSTMGIVTWMVTLPFRALQRITPATRLDTGAVVSARRP